MAMNKRQKAILAAVVLFFPRGLTGLLPAGPRPGV